MAMQLGNMLGAIANVTTAISEPKSLQGYLKNLDSFGVQVRNNFEVNFSGLETITFFVTDINFGGIQQLFTEVYYNGQIVYIPTNFEYDHNGSMTLINDGSGYIYSALTNFMMSNAFTRMVNTGYTMTIKCLNGDSKYKGGLVTLEGVMLEQVGGLSFGYAQNDISTFDVSFKFQKFTFTPGALGAVAGIIGGVESLLG